MSEEINEGVAVGGQGPLEEVVSADRAAEAGKDGGDGASGEVLVMGEATR